MRFFALSFDMLLVRYFLMMACVIGGLFAGQPLICFLALPLFLSALLGISFKAPEAKKTAVSLPLTSAPDQGLNQVRKAA